MVSVALPTPPGGDTLIQESLGDACHASAAGSVLATVTVVRRFGSAKDKLVGVTPSDGACWTSTFTVLETPDSVSRAVTMAVPSAPELSKPS